jgi:predicted secreted Zn-dependent protease
MQRELLFLLCLSLFLFCSSVTSAEITQHFDSEGNILGSGSRSREGNSPSGTLRYFVPEGVTLQDDIQYEFYPVFGKTFSEIVRSAEENSPVGMKNKRHLPSRSDWTVDWSYEIDYLEALDEEEKTVHASVDIYDISIRYHIRTTLPALIDDTALNADEKGLWKHYYRTLMEYENDHARIISDKNAQEELRSKFSELDYVVFDYSSNIDIEKTVETFIQKETEKIGSEWVKKLKKRIDEYNRVTEFGLALQKRDSFFSQPGK